MSVTVAVRDAGDDAFCGSLLDEGVTLTDHEEEADVLVVVGDDALRSLADDDPTVPVLPVGTSVGPHGVSREQACRFLADRPPATLDARTVSHPVVSVDVAGDEVWGVLDVALVTSEPAHISEYTVADGSAVLGSFRADGVVVATPAGTTGYARRLGTPVAAAETGVVAVAPIAPFATNPDHWLVGDDRVRLTVERDEAAVRLFADDRSITEVAHGEPVVLTTDRSVAIAVVEQSRPRFP